MKKSAASNAAAKTGMLIRKPAAQVFEAFVDPAITSKFWFSRGSGRLEAGKTVEWTWEWYGFTVPARVTALERDKRLVVEWGPAGKTTTIEWTFNALSAATTFVEITNHGFTGDAAAVVSKVSDSAGGFSFVLAGLKAWLEHGIALNLVPDRHPRGLAREGA